VRETKEKFEADLPGNIKGASPAAITLIHDLKPYKIGGSEPLWRLHSLDIMDKHQAIIPVWSRCESINIGPVMHARMMELWKSLPDMAGRGSPAAFDVWLKPEDRSPLYDGAELLRIFPAAQSEHDDKHQFRIEVAFGQSQVLEGEPVVPALSQLADYVSGVFEPFEVAILR
jgi:hypothetical protein